MAHKGSCHCGRIAYEVDGDIDALVQCNCSICSKKGYLLYFIARDRLTLKTPETHLSTYTFNKHQINHHFCSSCGCSPFGIGSDQQGNTLAAINARCLDDLDISGIPIQPLNGRAL